MCVGAEDAYIVTGGRIVCVPGTVSIVRVVGTAAAVLVVGGDVVPAEDCAVGVGGNAADPVVSTVAFVAVVVDWVIL